MEKLTVDVVVIGSGPAGQKAAIQAAKLKKTVVVIEKEGFLGGACLHTGTIPSKTLRAAILDLTEFYLSSFYSKEYHLGDISISDLNFRLKKVIDSQLEMIERQFHKNQIRIIYGNAEFESDKSLFVKDGQKNNCTHIQFNSCVLATGSQPRNPSSIPFDQKYIFDSSTLLKIDKLPKTMIVLGGGIIGSEYASFFAALGVEVTVIDKKDHMLPKLDREIGIHLQNGLSEIGLKFLAKKVPKIIDVRQEKVYVECEDGTFVTADILLYALGREPNIDELKINNAGITLASNGYLAVNDSFQTLVPHIYAVGDVIGGASLASTSMEQGRLAALSMCKEQTHLFPKVFPLGIYTIPEISCCGYTEEEVKKLNRRYEVGRAYYYEIAASQIYGSNNMGVIKLIFDADTHEILGVHIIGRGATEVIHIGQTAMSFGGKVDFFVDQIFNYPTFAEGYRIAALNGINKLKLKKA